MEGGGLEARREHALSVAAMREAARDRIARQAGEILEGRSKEVHRPAAEIDADIKAVELALEQLRQDAVAETLAASATVRARVAPRHAELVRDVADKLLALHEAHVAYLSFADELNAKNVAWSALGPMHATFLGNPQDRYSPVAQWFREARRAGFISSDMIPEALRHG